MQIKELNLQTGEVTEREYSAEEAAADSAAAQAYRELNSRALILSQLAEIDAKTPRAMREALLTGNNSRVQELEHQAVSLRESL